jgi:hypothetical protein
MAGPVLTGTMTSGVGSGLTPSIGGQGLSPVGNVDLVNAAKGATQNIGQLVQAFNTLSTAIAGTTSPNSLVAAGYQVFPGGLILNWGTGSTSTGTGSITFSKAFPTACLGVFLTATGSGIATLNALIASSAPTVTGSAVYSASGTSLTFFYLGIGH